MLRGTAFVLAIGAMALAASLMPGPTLKTDLVPVRMANPAQVLLVAPHEVTVAEWNACFTDGACSYSPKSRVKNSNMPVTEVNYFDVNEYITWINAMNGKTLRLPTSEEWTWLNRSLQKPPLPPAFTDPRLAWAADYLKRPVASGPVKPAGTFSTTADGISDLDGNVWEWTSTCAKPLRNGSDPDDCPAYVAEGEHEAAISIFVREPASGGCATGTPPTHVGFRLVADVQQ